MNFYHGTKSISRDYDAILITLVVHNIDIESKFSYMEGVPESVQKQIANYSLHALSNMNHTI